MSMQRVAILTAAIFALALPTAQAGPCSAEIDRIQARIDARLAATATTGAGAPESPAALLHRQPTPGSIAKAEEGLGELSVENVLSVQRGMEQARAADRVGDARACVKALTAVERALGR
jgi:hypothetical protein